MELILIRHADAASGAAYTEDAMLVLSLSLAIVAGMLPVLFKLKTLAIALSFSPPITSDKYTRLLCQVCVNIPRSAIWHRNIKSRSNDGSSRVLAT